MIKKCLVFFLALSLFGLAGCRILGGGDDDGGTTGPASSVVTTINPTLKIAKNVGTASILAAIDTTDAVITIIKSDGTLIATMTRDTASDTTTELAYKATNVAASNFSKDTAGSNYVMNAKVTLTNGLTVTIQVLVPTALRGTTSTDTTAAVTVSVTLKTDASGNLTYTYDVAYVSSTTGAAASSGTLNPPSTFTAPTSPALYIEKVVWVNGSTETTLGTTEVTGLPFDSLVFKIYFNAAITAAPTTYSVTASTGVATVTFTESSTNPGTLTLDSTTKKFLTLTVDGQTGSTKMDPYKSYTITLNSGTITKDGSTATATLPTTGYKVKTKQAGLYKWEALDANDSVVGSWVSGSTATPTVTTAAKKIKLTFDYTITDPTTALSSSKFNKTKPGATSSTESSYSTYFGTPVFDSGKKIVTLPFNTGVALSAGNYTITHSSGSFTDSNGIALTTSNTISFTVQ